MHYFWNISNIINTSRRDESEDEEFRFENTNSEIIIDDDFEEKKEEKYEIFDYPNKRKNEPNSKENREYFNNLEAKFNEDYALKYICEKMDEVIKDDTQFKYEYLKNEIPKYKPQNLNHPDDLEIKTDENLSISELIENSKFISSKIFEIIAKWNYEDIDKEILSNKLEANILVDVARTLSNENRYFNMLIVCGLTTALYYLNIPYTLSLIGDSNFKVRIKNADDPHNLLNLQKLYDCCFIKRNITQLPTCLNHFITKYPAKDESINRVFYIFTNGYDDELKKYNAWKLKIFNNIKNSFSFIFTKSEVLDKPKNKNYRNYLEEIWIKFEKESKESKSFVTLTKTSFKEINDLKNLIENLSIVLFRKKDDLNKDRDNPPKFHSLFYIDNSKKLTSNYIDLFKHILKCDLTKNDKLYVTKPEMPKIYDIQKDDKKNLKNFV